MYDLSNQALPLKSLFLLAIIGIALSCRHSPTTHTPGATANPSKQQAHPSDSTDIIITPCAVMIDPTEAKLKQLKKEDGEENFYSMADDNQFYMGTAIGYLDSIHYKMIDRQSKGTIKFRTAAGNLVKMNLTKYDWAILLFNGKDTPIEADITTFKDEFERYMPPAPKTADFTRGDRKK
ncbi:MAG TPA: hypothetical protein VNS58_09435 [Puia sp.]|nr:hypothetical protein [Puia sp.]